MQTLLATAEDEGRWDQFVSTHPAASNYHRWGWKGVIERSFRWPTYYLAVEQEGRVIGILPLVWQKSLLFGSFLTSLPFLNWGGVVAESREAEQALVQEAIGIAQRVGAHHLELRHRQDHQLGLPAKTSKVAAVRAVEADSERMWRSLDPKVRTDIRKAMKSGLVAEVGGPELGNEFYEIFAQNMRDLGTPVYGRQFFLEMLKTFPSETYICLVRHQGAAVAASFLAGYRDTIEVGWSSSLRRYLPRQPNMLLYWRNLCLAGERGYSRFDFGRSTAGSGTHRFKMQWGCEEIPLHWDYWLPNGATLPEMNPQNPKYRLAIGLWKRLPLAITRLVGPRIVRCLP